MELLHAGQGWEVLGMLAVVSFVTSFITAAFGIGGGILMLAVLASLLPPAAVIPVHGLVQLGSNAGRVALLLRHVLWPMVLPFTLGSVLGVVLGGLTVVQLSAGWLQVAVGAFILWSVLASPPAILRRSLALTGVFSSFLSMFVGGTGPFVATVVKAQGPDRHGQVATHSTLMTIQHALKTATFAALGFAFSDWAVLIAALIATGLLGTLVGRLVLRRSSDRHFKLILNGILTVLAVRLIWAGVVELWPGGGQA